MAQERTPGEPAVIEPAYVPEVFIDGVLPPEDFGDLVKITGYSNQVVPGTTTPVRVVVLRCVWMKSAYMESRKDVDSRIRPPAPVLTMVK